MQYTENTTKKKTEKLTFYKIETQGNLLQILQR